MNLDAFVKAPTAAPIAPVGFNGPSVDELDLAAQRLSARTDGFGVSMRDTAADLAAKLRRFGSYASAKQADFARRIVDEYSRPRAQHPEQAAPTPRPNTWKTVQGFARITIGDVSFRKQNAEPVWWIKFSGVLVSRLAAGVAIGFGAKIRAAGLDAAKIKEALDAIEADPVEALKAHGIDTGSCGCCGRELTDPGSIKRGIGPICWARGGF